MMDVADSHLPQHCRGKKTSPNPRTAAILARLPVTQQEKGLKTPSHMAVPTPSENADCDGDHRFLVCYSLQETGESESSVRSDFSRTCL